MSFKIKASEVSFHLQRLSNSPIAWEAVEKNDKETFVKICKTLRIPEKYIKTLLKIVYSVEPEQWPTW